MNKSIFLKSRSLFYLDVKKIKLTEEEYHSLCETNLRYTDSLGKMLGKRFGLEYTNKTLAYFEYKLENNWLLCIPNSLVYGVNIYIPNYVRKDFDTDFNIIIHKSAMRKAKEDLDVINREFFDGNTIMDKWSRYVIHEDMNEIFSKIQVDNDSPTTTDRTFIIPYRTPYEFPF